MNPSRKNILVFGYGLSVILSLAFLRSIKFGRPAPYSFVVLILAFAMAGLTLFRSPLVDKIYFYWMKAAVVIGQIVTAGILTAMFYGVFSPVGIILRILRKDLLDQKREPDRNSFWQRREADSSNLESYTKQF